MNRQAKQQRRKSRKEKRERQRQNRPPYVKPAEPIEITLKDFKASDHGNMVADKYGHRFIYQMYYTTVAYMTFKKDFDKMKDRLIIDGDIFNVDDLDHAIAMANDYLEAENEITV